MEGKRCRKPKAVFLAVYSTVRISSVVKHGKNQQNPHIFPWFLSFFPVKSLCVYLFAGFGHHASSVQVVGAARGELCGILSCGDARWGPEWGPFVGALANRYPLVICYIAIENGGL